MAYRAEVLQKAVRLLVKRPFHLWNLCRKSPFLCGKLVCVKKGTAVLVRVSRMK